jgi:hypothetical protein
MRLFPVWLVRVLGMTAVALAGYFLLVDVLGKTDINWALPWKKFVRAHWPDLPFFSSWKETTADGKEEVIYQVPSRQLTKEEIARLRYIPPATNAPPISSGR